MNLRKRAISLLLCLCVILSVNVISLTTVNADEARGVAVLVGVSDFTPALLAAEPNIKQGVEGAELDVDAMNKILTPLGYGTIPIKSRAATKDRVLSTLSNLAIVLKPGDILVFYFSGHGSRVPDRNGDEEDGIDEAIVAYDGNIIDDELHEIWKNFKPGVKIVMISDSCFSGTVLKKTASQGNSSLDVLDNNSSINASLVFIGACQDNETTGGSPQGGAFTRFLEFAWTKAKFTGTYEQLHRQLVNYLAYTGNTPSYYEYGAKNEKFTKGNAFAISGDFQAFNLQTPTAIHETDSTFKFLLDANKNLFAIKKSNTGTNRTEVHILTAASGYQKFGLQAQTALPETYSNYDFMLDPYTNDLYAVQKSGHSSKNTVIHVIPAKYLYQKCTKTIVTSLGETNSNHEFLFAPNKDIYVINKANTSSRKAELQILSASSGYKSISLQTTIQLPAASRNYSFTLDSDKNLYAVNRSGSTTYATEVTMFRSPNYLPNYTVGTALHITDSNYEFLMGSNKDIFVIKKKNTGFAKTEVHVLDY
ncbi:MAG: Caspase domain protein [Firmicutes bacterium ADurb.Bin419]|nr:MAG: Caspase domain protein [Firmicutes bacterium ADurb.Bin419]